LILTSTDRESGAKLIIFLVPSFLLVEWAKIHPLSTKKTIKFFKTMPQLLEAGHITPLLTEFFDET
jgi:hypothetical protein